MARLPGPEGRDDTPGPAAGLVDPVVGTAAGLGPGATRQLEPAQSDGSG